MFFMDVQGIWKFAFGERRGAEGTFGSRKRGETVNTVNKNQGVFRAPRHAAQRFLCALLMFDQPRNQGQADSRGSPQAGLPALPNGLSPTLPCARRGEACVATGIPRNGRRKPCDPSLETAFMLKSRRLP
jgi:hypothetical protein